MRKGTMAAAALACALASGCGEKARGIHVEALSSPAPPSSLVPQTVKLTNGDTVLSWQTKLAGGGYRFEMAVGRGGRWSEVRQIANGAKLSMYTVDLPGIAELPAGGLLAYWELKDPRDGDPYATAIQTAVSRDEGRTWSAAARPYGDAVAGQHSFLSWFPSDSGIGLVWLDAQQQGLARMAAMRSGEKAAEGGEMGSIGLRYADLDAQGQVRRDGFIAPITCECCPTAAAVTGSGPVVVYRGRVDAPGTKPSEVREDLATVRDIYLTRLEGGRWTAPRRVHADNWVINGCPDNGPAVDAEGRKVAVAWWTRSGNDPKAQVAFSNDAGNSFGPAVRVDAGKAEGQVTVALLPGGRSATVGWLENGQAWARTATADGVKGAATALGRSPKHARLPRWVWDDGAVLAAWTAQTGTVTQVAVARLRL